jgi:hypothetical protein
MSNQIKQCDRKQESKVALERGNTKDDLFIDFTKNENMAPYHFLRFF